MKKSSIYPYGAVILSMLLWGMSFVWTAILLRYYEPVTIIVLRLVISTLFLLLWMRLLKAFQRIEKRDIGLFLLSALFNPFFYFIGENYGVKFTSPTVSAVFIATIPLVTPIAAFVVLKERLSWLNLAGLIISFAGVLMVILRKDLSFEFSLWGIGALLFAVFSAVGYSIFLKKLTLRYNAIFIVGIQNILGLIYFLPYFLFVELDQFNQIELTAEIIVSLLALAIFCSSFAFIGFTIAMREIGVSKANVFTNLIPIFTGIFSYFVIGEDINSQKLIGIVIVITGLFFTQLKNTKTIIPWRRY